MPRNPSPAQIEASMTNGRRSLGPVSPPGRRAAARNSTRHGMTGLGKCLPPDMEHEMGPEVAMFSAAYHPQNAYERDLIWKAALGNLRARRLNLAANAHADERGRNASRLWDEARDQEVAALADRLDAEPAEALRLLSRMSEGCDYLGDAWEALGDVLKARGHWDESEATRALRLLGFVEPPAPEDTGPLAEFWQCVLALRFEHHPEPIACPLPDPTEALDLLRRFVRDRVIECERLEMDLRTFYDEPSRNSAAARAAFDGGPDAARLQRYIKDAERMRDRAIAELHRLRREERLGRIPAPVPAPTRNESEPSPARDEPEPQIESKIPPEPAAQNEPERLAASPKPVAKTRLASIDPLDFSALDRLVSAPVGVETLPLSIARKV